MSKPGMPRRQITPEQITQIGELRDRGFSIGRIAMKLGLPRDNITYWVLTTGAVRPKDKFGQLKQADCMRNGRPVRRFSDEEDALILKMSLDGVRVADIARHVNRTSNTVGSRLKILACREAIFEAQGVAC